MSDALGAHGGKGRTPVTPSPRCLLGVLRVPPAGTSHRAAPSRPACPVSAAGVLGRIGAHAPRLVLHGARPAAAVCSTTGRSDRVPPQPEPFWVPGGCQMTANGNSKALCKARRHPAPPPSPPSLTAPRLLPDRTPRIHQLPITHPSSEKRLLTFRTALPPRRPRSLPPQPRRGNPAGAHLPLRGRQPGGRCAGGRAASVPALRLLSPRQEIPSGAAGSPSQEGRGDGQHKGASLFRRLDRVLGSRDGFVGWRGGGC